MTKIFYSLLLVCGLTAGCITVSSGVPDDTLFFLHGFVVDKKADNVVTLAFDGQQFDLVLNETQYKRAVIGQRADIFVRKKLCPKSEQTKVIVDGIEKTKDNKEKD